jgi:hypothetical protein
MCETVSSGDLMAQVGAACASPKLGMIFFNRDNAILNESAIEKTVSALPEPFWIRP